MTCPCDVRVFPRALAVPAGLRAKTFVAARTLGFFPDWRSAILAEVAAEVPLDAWRAREAHDLGLMLVEMGAYVFDVTDLHDALVAGEGFLTTAQLDGRQRRLVGLLGYLPRPAVAAEAHLATQADGRRVVHLPAGTAFRSGEFDGNAPQVFELTQPANVDPRVNRLGVQRVPQDEIVGSTITSVLVDPASVRVRPGDPVVLDFSGTLRTARVASLLSLAPRDRTPTARLFFTAGVDVPTGSTWSGMRVLASGGTTGLWKLGQIGSDTQPAISGGEILLESLSVARPGSIVMFEQGTALWARRVTSTVEHHRTLFASLTSNLKDAGGANAGSVVSPPIKVPITRLALDTALSGTTFDLQRLVVHHPLGLGARVLVVIRETLGQTDPIRLPDLVDPPRVNVSRVLLEDVHHEGVVTGASLDAATRTAQVGQGESWGRTLTAAVTLFGNVLEVSRGESVAGEVLGVGDASQERQTFRLRKKPLTYLSAATASGIRSSLRVRVGGLLWTEVESFYLATETDRTYVVRHDEDGQTDVTFGGGARLPTGALVTAEYRHGAGAATPPAGSIAQLAKPVPGLNGVRNVLAAFGGSDAERSDEIAAYAPRSALLLGRAVSLPDLEAAASTVAGVQAARAAWRWDEQGQRAVAQILYIGSEQLRETVRARLRSLSEPDAPIRVVRSLPQSAHMVLSVGVRPDALASDVVAAVKEALARKPALPGTGGLLRPERLGPEGVVFLSQVVAAVMGVDGVEAVRSASFDGAPFVESGRRPLAGRHFDFGEPGTSSNRLVIHGVA